MCSCTKKLFDSKCIITTWVYCYLNWPFLWRHNNLSVDAISWFKRSIFRNVHPQLHLNHFYLSDVDNAVTYPLCDYSFFWLSSVSLRNYQCSDQCNKLSKHIIVGPENHTDPNLGFVLIIYSFFHNSTPGTICSSTSNLRIFLFTLHREIKARNMLIWLTWRYTSSRNDGCEISHWGINSKINVGYLLHFRYNYGMQ